jgi:hypothetical protein
MRKPNRAAAIQAELETLKNRLKAGGITSAQYGALSARLLQELKRVKPDRPPYAIT